MDLALFSSLLQNLLHISVFPAEGDALRAFEEKFCYHPGLQPSFTAAALAAVSERMQDHVFYGLRDELGIAVLLFRHEGRAFLAGPYVKTEFDAPLAQRVLIRSGLPASYATSVRLYYSAFPILSTYQVRNTVAACLRSLSGTAEEFTYCRLRSGRDPSGPPQGAYAESLDYSTIYQRYDIENRFLRMIEAGDTENVLSAYHDMSLQRVGRSRYVNAFYLDPSIGLTMVRALARKAAERGGASLIEINEITQRAVQRIYTVSDMEEQLRYTSTMILELTEAVRRSRYRTGSYSEAIARATEFLSLNYSQKIELSQLAARVGLSETYLCRAFKKEVGMTVTGYIANLRCTQAAELLRSTSNSIQEISGYVGYPDSNYFVKVFKKQYRMTPSDYRAQAAQ